MCICTYIRPEGVRGFKGHNRGEDGSGDLVIAVSLCDCVCVCVRVCMGEGGGEL